MHEKLEQHIGTIMQILVIGLLGWSLKTSVDLSSQVSVLLVRVSALEALVQQGANDRYRGTDAARDMAAIWAEIARHDVRITRIESKQR